MFKKNCLKFILSVLLIFSFCLMAQAADKVEPPNLDLQVPIPGQEDAGRDLASYVSAWYTFGIGAVGIIAVIMIMWAGFQWMTAGGNAAMISQAKQRISNALIGLILALCSYSLLYLINPALVELKLPYIKQVSKEDIKEYKYPSIKACEAITEKDDCQKIGCIWIKEKNICVSSLTCELVMEKVSCEGSVGCMWIEEENKCIDSPIKCGLSKEEKEKIVEIEGTTGARCCGRIDENWEYVEYKYAIVPMGRSCGDVCGPEWINRAYATDERCINYLGY